MKRDRTSASLRDGDTAASNAMDLLTDGSGRKLAQRNAIVEALFASHAELTAQELRDRVRAHGRIVSLTTVHVTLNKLVGLGLARQRRHGRQQARFGPVLGQADHGRLVCTACRSITEFTDDRIKALHESIARSRGFELRARKYEIYGICERCRGREALE
jgi:Fur family ferric uptake transcriptional regulator